MKWREMFKLAVNAARTEAKLAAEKVGDWLAESPVAPSSPVVADPWADPKYLERQRNAPNCECGRPKEPCWFRCVQCHEEKRRSHE